MRFLALLLLPSMLLAFPAPKPAEKPTIEVILSARNQLECEITIRNHGKEPYEIAYLYTPFERLVIELRGQTGKIYLLKHDEDDPTKVTPGTFTIPSGGSKSISVHTCHSLPEVCEPGEAVTFTARFKYDGKSYESKSVTVK
jgi:hypothetical protein